jgi:hypothetical protein
MKRRLTPTPPTLLAGAVVGGLHHKGLGIDSDERDEIAGALTNGRAAVGVLADNIVVEAVSDRLTELGGELHVLSPSDEAVAEVDAAPSAARVSAAERAARQLHADHVGALTVAGGRCTDVPHGRLSWTTSRATRLR